MKILVTGGAGYIGSHICVELIQAGHDVVVIDDFSNSQPEVLDYIREITGKDVEFYEFNILDEEKTEKVFQENQLDAIIHCAAFKAVGESVSKPIEYYTNNLMTTLIVTKMMRDYHVNNIVFSSSATVYGCLLYTSEYYLKSLEKISPISSQFTYSYFMSILESLKPTMSIKAFLATEQRFPGIGNGVLQDILWEASLHPKRKVNSLSKQESQQLFKAIQNILGEMIEPVSYTHLFTIHRCTKVIIMGIENK